MPILLGCSQERHKIGRITLWLEFSRKDDLDGQGSRVQKCLLPIPAAKPLTMRSATIPECQAKRFSSSALPGKHLLLAFGLSWQRSISHAYFQGLPRRQRTGMQQARNAGRRVRWRGSKSDQMGQ